MSKKFENLYEHPPLVTSVINPKPADSIKTIKRAIAKCTDAFIFQLERLDPCEKTSENLKLMFDAAKGFPIMVTNYPYDNNKGMSDDELLEFEFNALEAGAACLDVRADTFDRGAKHEITFDPDAVAKQKQVIEKIHSLGGQVIMSMHVWEFLDTETVLKYGREIASRGADIVKIVHMINDTDELATAIKTTTVLHREIATPVLHLLNGPCIELHRHYGTAFGSCLAFCVEEYIEGSSGAQPSLEKMVALRKLSNYKFFEKEGKNNGL